MKTEQSVPKHQHIKFRRREITRKKPYVFSTALFSDMTAGKINWFGAVHPHHNGTHCGFGYKTLKMKWGDIRARIRGDLTGVLREGK